MPRFAPEMQNRSARAQVLVRTTNTIAWRKRRVVDQGMINFRITVISKRREKKRHGLIPGLLLRFLKVGLELRRVRGEHQGPGGKWLACSR